MPLMLTLGLDLGSTAIKSALIDSDGRIVATEYRRHNGRPLNIAVELLGTILDSSDAGAIGGLAVTGSAARPLAETLGAPFYNEVVALGTAVARLHPEFRTAIEVGGDSAKIIELSGDAGQGGATSASGPGFRDFAMNSECAAGTGSFLDQQASRLGLRIEDEFARLALRSEKPPRVAGRCSVFAKSDMIHLQQQAVPDFDIVAGLCFAMARNFKATLARGRDLMTPIAFVGGVASNAGMVRAFREVFELGEDDFRVPEHHDRLPAIGAALLLQRSADLDSPQPLKLDEAALEKLLAHREAPASRIAPLEEPTGYMPSALTDLPDGQDLDVYLGLDVGSISTNLVLIDTQGRLVAKLYLMTAGRPIEAVRSGLKQLSRQWAGRVTVLGAASTGSGRYLTGDIVGADLVRNEITAQACGAAAVDPSVDTIFEIGGQDSKYIRLRDGVVVDFEMNHVCAAGTGSFLEEQAERLGISIKDEFARLALASGSPIRLGERCTVFMESDILHHQQQGAALEDLVAGLSYSIVANYLNRVVGTRSIGDHVLLQGGTAFNRAVTAAFAALTGRKITVPPHHEVTGAIGAALLVRDAHQKGLYAETSFRGFDLAERSYKVRSFTCQGCSNYCDIREVRFEGEPPLCYGSRCDRYNKKKSDGPHPSDHPSAQWPDLLAERERLLLGLPAPITSGPADAEGQSCSGPITSKVGKATRGVVGIPRALVLHGLLPFWRVFLERLGFETIVSPASEASIIQAGVESVLSQTCFPVKVAHGHVRWLVDRGVDAVLLPSVIALPRDHDSQLYNHLCPYVQTMPYQVESALNLAASGVKVLRPIVDFEDGYQAASDGLVAWGKPWGFTRDEIAAALKPAVQAQTEFERACLARGREVLASPPDGAQLAVLVGRPYNTCDAGINLDVARRMRAVGLLAVPMDMLDLRRFDLGDDWHNLYWKYGQRVVRAAEVIRQRPQLGAVYISNFGCGPDSFLKRFFQEAMGRRAFLSLEIDEHSAPAGLVTRLEAFVDSLRGAGPQKAEEGPRRIFPPATSGNERTLLVPHMCDHAFAFAAAFRGSGLKAEVIGPSDDESLALGRRHTSGRECLPCIVTAGDMLRELKRPDADPDRMAFFMPSGTGPCRFGMYSKLHRLILAEAGYPDVPVVSPNQGESFYEDFKKLERDPTRPAWCGIVAVDTLIKALHATRPQETRAGMTEAVYRACLKAVERALEHGKPLPPVMAECAERFRAIETDGNGRRPLVGIVGEIYVRSHTFSNQGIVSRLEALGLEVDLASFAEWIYYTNWTRKRRTRGRGQWRLWLGTWVKEKVQRMDERRIKRPMADLIGEPVEAETGQVVALGNPYIDDSFEGEAILSLGKAVEMATHGQPRTGRRAAGIVNVMPFTCMPGNIVAGMLKRLRRDLGDLPILSVAYDGQADSALEVRLEAFAEQVKSFANRPHRF